MTDDPIRFDGLTYHDLAHRQGLVELDRRFCQQLAETAPELEALLQEHRHPDTPSLTDRQLGDWLISVGPHLEAFLAELFGVEEQLKATRDALTRDAEVLAFRRDWVQKRVRRRHPPAGQPFSELDQWLERQLEAHQLNTADRELAIARFARELGGRMDEMVRESFLDWCAAALHTPEGQAAVDGWAAFRLPQRVDHAHLVDLQPEAGQKGQPIRFHAPRERWRSRDGFALTDGRAEQRQVSAEAHYCIYCHDHEGDFCSRGFPEKKGDPELGFKVDPLGVQLTGCPLEEQISEMNRLYRDGHPLAALAVAMVDNPMVPATGHRICNDCMKSCIYQKQDPVDIPQIETRALTDVLDLPYGVELYHLLTRWNPLRAEQYLPAEENGRRVLIAGQGPAGFTMAHYLTMAGCTVVAVDGLKVEPLPDDWLKGPVRDWSAVWEPLEERTLYGFGGVAEYGITNRWDKNFLKLIYLTLARRARYSIHGGVRLGGTLTLEDAWQLGFDHVCIATGAGYPRVLEVGNSLARGMRQANDFLMALQLTGAGKAESIANLQVRMPAVVIGGGLTAVDTATEVQAHYIAQVEKVLERYEALSVAQGETSLRAGLNEEDTGILDELLGHGRAVRQERERAQAAGEEPQFAPLLHQWGGVTIAYRKGLTASPAYVRNHEELAKATEEGILYAEGLEPIHARLDGYEHVQSVVFRRMRHEAGRWFATGREVELPARSVFVAAGTVPNTIYAHEHPGSLSLDGTHYRTHSYHRNGLQPVARGEHCKAPEIAPFTSHNKDGRTVTFLGDTHPVFAGSVVKAIASAQRSYPLVLNALTQLPNRPGKPARTFLDNLAARLTPRVVSVEQPSPAVAEIWIRAPLAAARFQPGQFFRLQTLETHSPVVAGTRLQVPLMTVSGTGIDGDCIRLMVLQWGAAPRIAARLKPGDPVVLMGPTGAPTAIPEDQTVMVVAGRWGAAVMHDIGSALREAGNRVLYIAAFGSADEIDHPDELEAGADQIVWATAREPGFQPRRPQDSAAMATDMVELVRRYDEGQVAPDAHRIPLSEVDRILVVGGTGLLRGFQEALGAELGQRFPDHLQAIGTVGSPMQCMLKGVCAQCLQWQIDPETGERTRAVFSCAEQDQPLGWIDIGNLSARQQQNRLLDRLTGAWVDHLLRQQPH